MPDLHHNRRFVSWFTDSTPFTPSPRSNSVCSQYQHYHTCRTTTNMSALITSSPSVTSKVNGNFVPTRIFINQVPEYDLLPFCAETEVSSIVRNMANGCGDGSRTTSYACFCYDSSTHFNSLIGSHVATACEEDPSQATSAKAVFNKYCQIGQTRGLQAPTRKMILILPVQWTKLTSAQ